MTVLDRILNLRIQRNWTEYRLSEESGIPQTTISSWYKKEVTPTVSSLEKICSAFNITMSEFFAFENTPVALTDRERQILENWNKMSNRQQELLLEFIESM